MFLWIITLICLRILAKDTSFDRQNFWRKESIGSFFQPLLIQFLVISLILCLLLYFLKPEWLFLLMREKTLLWIAILFFYPLFSVYPQEIVYRAFFFHRYHVLFPNQQAMILVNAFVFGYMHIIFHNWIAVILTLGGGFLFANLYAKTHSLALLFIAHSLYGCMLFTLGLGQFFYMGSLATMVQTVSF
ncbi:CPBP family intramembrane glutamic endopeptidase [Sulfuricurvum sp.]|uniref:CPBP family intramembrane glutamic endopeptidase n=1 Tax=Sulfuricurvum sp. TaxID=2025608 RepID=UPI00262BC41F|nr:CPBP family intramembrane glutamic endopeptidase [Sulfuricurvum sp.]MDD2266314.1 CPBP family intramembrane metalloprotease [Sulfuricurvum sp.]MDD2784738.1 CPBP family intramembrane metalloprotease [Sulfuricurvum sp.]